MILRLLMVCVVGVISLVLWAWRDDHIDTGKERGLVSFMWWALSWATIILPLLAVLLIAAIRFIIDGSVQ